MTGEAVQEGTFGWACWRGRPEEMRAFHRHGEVELNFVRSGGATYLVEGTRVALPAGRLAVLWGTAPHRLVGTGPDTELCWLTVPLGAFLGFGLPEGFVGAVLRGGVLVDAREDAGDAGRFEAWTHDLAPGGDAGAAALEVHARLRRWARRFEAGTAEHARGAPGAGTAERMAAFIARESGRALRVADVAAAVGVSPHHAMAAFRRVFGMSVVEYLTRRRVAHAQRLLTTTDARILDVCFEVGFGSTSRFHEAFARYCGCSPREYRARARTGETAFL